MNSNDPKFGDCLFELCDLMRAKGDVGIISNIISEVIKIHKDAHCHDHKSNESLSLGDNQSQMMLNMDTMMRMMIVTLISMSL